MSSLNLKPYKGGDAKIRNVEAMKEGKVSVPSLSASRSLATSADRTELEVTFLFLSL